MKILSYETKVLIGKKLKFFLPITIYRKIKIIYFILKNPFIHLNLFLEYLFLKKEIVEIKQDLIIIGQIQRSVELYYLNFLMTTELYNYPGELILTSPKWNWEEGFQFSTFNMNELLRTCCINKNYEKRSKGATENIRTKNVFLFNPYIEKKIFENFQKKDLRSNFNAYFTAFFNAFKNYKLGNVKKKKLIIAFLPRFIMNDQNINLFFKIYPKSKLISIIRDPRSWLLSAKKHSNEYENTKFALESWKNSCERSLKLKKKYPKEFILTQFTDLVIDPNKTMRKICQLINISFNESLVKPTFNGDEINSDSAFKSVIGKG